MSTDFSLLAPRTIDKLLLSPYSYPNRGVPMLTRQKLKHQLTTILSLDNHPGHIAAGFAVGVFISFTPPIPGLHTILAISLAFLFRLNKLTCITGSWINSPLTIIPSMILCHKLGTWLLGEEPVPLQIQGLDWPSLKLMLVQHSKPLLLGCSVVGFVAALIAYVVCYRLVVAFRKKDDTLAELTREMEETGEDVTQE